MGAHRAALAEGGKARSVTLECHVVVHLHRCVHLKVDLGAQTDVNQTEVNLGVGLGRVSASVATLEATQGQNDGFFSQLQYTCYLEEEGSVADWLTICPWVASRVDGASPTCEVIGSEPSTLARGLGRLSERTQPSIFLWKNAKGRMGDHRAPVTPGSVGLKHHLMADLHFQGWKCSFLTKCGPGIDADLIVVFVCVMQIRMG